MEIDQSSYLVAACTFVVSTILFFIETGFFFKSVLAALICAGLVWVSYVALKWLILALKG